VSGGYRVTVVVTQPLIAFGRRWARRDAAREEAFEAEMAELEKTHAARLAAVKREAEAGRSRRAEFLGSLDYAGDDEFNAAMRARRASQRHLPNPAVKPRRNSRLLSSQSGSAMRVIWPDPLSG
jgi:hypothetical protein